jgi:hypothetical protein
MVWGVGERLRVQRRQSDVEQVAVSVSVPSRAATVRETDERIYRKITSKEEKKRRRDADAQQLNGAK